MFVDCTKLHFFYFINISSSGQLSICAQNMCIFSPHNINFNVCCLCYLFGNVYMNIWSASVCWPNKTLDFIFGEIIFSQKGNRTQSPNLPDDLSRSRVDTTFSFSLEKLTSLEHNSKPRNPNIFVLCDRVEYAIRRFQFEHKKKFEAEHTMRERKNNFPKHNNKARRVCGWVVFV